MLDLLGFLVRVPLKLDIGIKFLQPQYRFASTIEFVLDTGHWHDSP